MAIIGRILMRQGLRAAFLLALFECLLLARPSTAAGQHPAKPTSGSELRGISLSAYEEMEYGFPTVAEQVPGTPFAIRFAPGAARDLRISDRVQLKVVIADRDWNRGDSANVTATLGDDTLPLGVEWFLLMCDAASNPAYPIIFRRELLDDRFRRSVPEAGSYVFVTITAVDSSRRKGGDPPSMAIAAYKAKRYEEAATRLRKLVARRPKNDLYLSLYAGALYHTHRCNEFARQVELLTARGYGGSAMPADVALQWCVRGERIRTRMDY